MQKKTSTKASAARTVPVTSAAPVPTTPVAVTATAANGTPSREQIAQRAHEIYVARGQTSGHELEDWIQAERELVAKCHKNN